MQNSLPAKVGSYVKAHIRQKRWKRILTVLACAVVFCTTYALILPAITMTGDTFCGKEAHRHSDECYEKVLTCGLEETTGEQAVQGHTHTEACYTVESILTCDQEASEGHAHDSTCYDEEGTLICGQDETEGHTHIDDCYTTQSILTCGQDETAAPEEPEGHVHTDDCYEKRLICEKEEHEHTLQCYSNPDAVESPADWERTLPALTGDRAADLAAAAQSQLGYTESAVNYLVDADGETVHGYTRYGAWYGQPYAADWSALFASFCLHYANVPETVFPQGSSCESWLAKLQTMELYRASDSYSPNPGDVAFYDLDADGLADHAGIVLDGAIAAVGDVDGAVTEKPLDAVLGYGVLPTDVPAKAPLAETGDTRPIITVATDNSISHGNLTFYTGEAATTTLNLSNPESAQIAEDDGTVIRVYMKFAKKNPGEGHPASADGAPSQADGSYTVVASTGTPYTYTVTRIDGVDDDHYTYCLEFQRPLQGDTISINLPSGYPSPTSAGGTNTVWGVVLTKEEKEALDKTGKDGKPGIAARPENGENSQSITWETKRDDFSLEKSQYTDNSYPCAIAGDGKGGYYIANLQYVIRSDRETAQTLEGKGKDHVDSVTCVDSFTLPEGVRFADSFVAAVKNNTLIKISSDKSVPGFSGSVYGVALHADDYSGPGLVVSGAASRTDSNNVTLSLSEDKKTLYIQWTAHNVDWKEQPLTNQQEIGNLYRLISFYPNTLLIDSLSGEQDYTLQNKVDYTFHYSWSDDQKKEGACNVTVSAGEAQLKMVKHMPTYNQLFGTPTSYEIKLSNTGTLPYEKLCYVKDPLPKDFYLPADSMEKLFHYNGFGQYASVLITDATFCPDGAQHQTVTGMDGTTTGTTAARNTSEDSDTKYSGCSDSTRHPEDHTGSIDIRWNEGHTQLKLTFTKADGSTSTQTCEASAAAIQAALDAEHFLVTNFTRYTVQWDLRDGSGNPMPIYGGQELKLTISAYAKDTFMRLEHDQPGKYPEESVSEERNTAYAYGAGMSEQQEQDLLKSADTSTGDRSREFYLDKGATLADGRTMNEKHVPKDGETVDYSLTVQKKSWAASYNILPLTDHMSGAQVLLAEVEKNKDTAWATGCDIYTAADGTQYYKLSRAGTYPGVWLGAHYADSVSVTESASGRDTIIKWYFTNYTQTRTDTISYKALVCPKELKTEGLTFSLGNESWLGDHQTHRLYAPIGEIRGAMLEFNKKIVPESDIRVANDAKVEGEDYCPVSDGQTVYYRFLFKATAPEPEEGEQAQPATVTLTGSQLRDSLPLGLSKSGTDYLLWKKGTADAANAQPGDVWIVGYQNATSIQNEANWDISGTGTENQQEIHWDDNFSVSFTSEKPLYFYVRLTFPKDANWQEFAAQYSSTELVNTLYVDGVPDSVTHDLKTQAKAVLQKGVYRTGGQESRTAGGPDYTDKEKDSLFYYQNYDMLYRSVCYSVVLYNDGGTRLYINDMQDVLPRGFTFGGHFYIYTSPSYSSSFGNEDPNTKGYTSPDAYYSTVSPSSGTKPEYKFLAIDTDVQTQDGVQLLTFHFKKDDTNSNAGPTPEYDEERGKFYLEPGEAISFAYYAFTHERKDTDDAAVNSIAMPYYDYTGGGLCVGDEAFHRKDFRAGDYSSYTPNDGSCAVIDNTQAVASGRTGVSNDTQWLYSQVEQIRSEIKPGITKKLTAAVGTNGTVTNDPLAAHPTDTLRWSVTAANDGRYPIYDYVLSDTMQEPYLFDGKVSYMIYSAEQKVYGTYDLFSISAPDETGCAAVDAYRKSTVVKHSLPVNGDAVELEAYGYGPNYSNRYFKYQVRLTQDNETGRYTLSIRFPDKVCAIPAGGTGVLTLETKRTDNQLINTVFVNTCFITPMEQTWDNTANKGNVTTLDDVFSEDNKPTVRNSAPVTTAYGYATSSLKSVEEKENPRNKAACNDSPNYIVLPGKESLFTYTLRVDAPEKAMDKLILIDGLPDVNDHTCFQNDDPRYSEFKVVFAENPSVTVTVTKEDKSVTTLISDQFTVEYSDRTEFVPNDWNGRSEWSSSSTNARSLRVKILDESGTLIPANSHVSVRFDAKIEGDAAAGQIAWNSFGYNYSVVDDSSELEAAPLKVGVMIPGVPEIIKQIVDQDGTPAAVKAEKTFRFLLYTGTSLKETDEAKLAEALTTDNRKAALIELTVKAGQNTSDRLKLDSLQVCTYNAGQWTQTGSIWTWENGSQYTLVELPDDDPTYKFRSVNRSTTADGFQFTYQNDQTLVLSAVNLLDTWRFTIRKTDAGDGAALTGAWFALYSPEQADQMTEGAYNALSDRPTNRPDFTLTVGEGENAKTWYLTRVGQTRDMEGKSGTLIWDDLLRDEYLYREIQAPMGYQLDDTIRTAKKTDIVHSITISNTGNGVRLPETGGIGTGWFTAGGILLLTACLLGYCLTRKRERRRG